MKKLLVMLLAAILALSATAFAATYNYDNDITFEYDDKALEITFEEHKDDEDRIILGFKDAAWDDGYITIQVQDIEDGDHFPTNEEIAKEINVDVSTLETLASWGNFTNVVTATFTTDDFTETMFFAPVTDDDGEVEDILTVVVGTTAIENEEIATQRDDAISTIIDTLKVDD